MEQNARYQYNSTISVFRALAALFVVSQHVPYEGSINIIYYLMCTAVPFFFLVAGYFSWNRDQITRKNKLWKHLKKIMTVYVVAYLFYYLVSVGLKYALKGLLSCKYTNRI